MTIAPEKRDRVARALRAKVPTMEAARAAKVSETYARNIAKALDIPLSRPRTPRTGPLSRYERALLRADRELAARIRASCGRLNSGGAERLIDRWRAERAGRAVTR